MPVSNPDFPSSKAFDLIAEGLKDEKQKKDAIKQAKSIFAFTITNSGGKTESWHIDLKETGTVGKGVAPSGKKPAVTLVLSDENFAKLINNEAKAQSLFMGGKLKIKGDMMKATKLETILTSARPSGAKL